LEVGAINAASSREPLLPDQLERLAALIEIVGAETSGKKVEDTKPCLTLDFNRQRRSIE